MIDFFWFFGGFLCGVIAARLLLAMQFYHAVQAMARANDSWRLAQQKASEARDISALNLTLAQNLKEMARGLDKSSNASLH